MHPIHTRAGKERVLRRPSVRRAAATMALLALVACEPDDLLTNSAGDAATGGMAPTAPGGDAALDGTTTGDGSTTQTTGDSSTDATGIGGDASAGTTGSDAGTGSAADGSVTTPAPTHRAPATTRTFPVADRELVEDEPRFNVFRPADLSQPGFKLPVVVWGNGGCLRSDFLWAGMFQRWASAGFVVLSLTGGSGAPDDLLGMALAGATDASHQRQLIDWVEAQNASGPYAGMLDLERIIVAGNSCGGETAIGAAALDDRIAGIFVLSGSSAIGASSPEVMAEIKVPLGFVVGSATEDMAAAPALGDYQALGDGIAGMIVNRFEGDHFLISAGDTILPEIGEIALNWMVLVLYGTQQAYDALTSANVCDSCTPGWWTLQGKNLDTLLQ